MSSTKNARFVFCCLTIAAVLMAVRPAGADNISWNVAGNGDWDTITANWTGDDTFYSDGDDVTFGNTAGGTINIVSAVLPGSTTVSAASGTYTFSGSGIGGSGTLNKSGGGILTLDNSANGFTGALNLGGGEVQFTDANQLGNSASAVAVSADTTLNFNAPGNTGTTVAKPTTIASGQTLTLTRTGGQHFPNYSGQISGDGGLRIESTLPNYWRISNSSNNFSGGFTIDGNAVVNNDGAFGANSLIDLQSGSLTVNSGVTGTGKTVQIGGGGATFGTSGGTWEGLVTGGAMRPNNAGLNNAGNNYSATTYVGVAGQTFRIGVAGSIGSGPVTYDSNSNNNLLFTDTVGGTFTNTMNMSSGTRGIGVAESTALIEWTGSITASGAITKTGPGTFAVTNWNATGTLDINDGTFLMNDPATTGMNDVTVANGATLGGDGMIGLAGGKMVHVLDGGELAPGNSPGTLTIDGDLVLDDGALLTMELGSPADMIDVSGNLDSPNVAGGITLSLSTTSGYGSVVPYVLIEWGTSDLALSDITLLGGLFGELAIEGNQLLFISGVPEPSTLALLALLGIGAIGRLRRRSGRN